MAAVVGWAVQQVTYIVRSSTTIPAAAARGRQYHAAATDGKH